MGRLRRWEERNGLQIGKSEGYYCGLTHSLSSGFCLLMRREDTRVCLNIKEKDQMDMCLYHNPPLCGGVGLHISVHIFVGL